MALAIPRQVRYSCGVPTMNTNKPIEVFAFTDPLCTWCWGSEPILRKMQAWYGQQVKIRYVMGGLVKDIRKFYDSANDIGGDPELSNSQIVRHWLEASQHHGMPVKTEGFRMFSAEVISTYPQNIAFKAAELTDATNAPRFLRRLREASAAEARETGRREVLIELAGDAGLDIAAFIGHLNDGSAELAFQADLKLTRAYRVRGFPTFVFRYEDREIMLRSFLKFEDVRAVIDTLSGGSIVAKPIPNGPEHILDFLRNQGRAAPIELITVFGLSPIELEHALNGLIQAGHVQRTAAGNGAFLEATTPRTTCDPETGTCSI